LMAVAIGLLLVWQHWARTHGVFSYDVSSRRTYWQIQYLLLPALLALALRHEQVVTFVRRFLKPWVAFTGTITLLLADYAMRAHPAGLRPIVFVAKEELFMDYFFGFWVIATMMNPGSLTTRFLELAPLRFLGRISYSIYLWQQLFFWGKLPDTNITWRPLVIASAWPVRFMSVLVLACLSYYCIERPFIRWGHRLAPPSTPGHRDLDVVS
jgi:peptidoglycan/LPS O-acetylase OafA/YrhL